MDVVALDARGAAEVLERLAALEHRHGVPRLEAAERRRLAAHASGSAPGRAATDRSGWAPHAIDGWYLGVRARPDGPTVGEAGRLDSGDVTAPLAAAAAAGADRVWLRGAAPADVAAAGDRGWRPQRTLLILARDLAGPGGAAEVAPPEGLRLAPLAAVGAGPVAGLLERAHDGPRRDGLVEADPEAGPWTAERFDRAAAVALADPTDLLLAVDNDGALVGAHWTGRRAAGSGEVFNLAVDPASGGRGIGTWLLAAGLAHLAGLGMHEVVLWVDRDNTPARGLYARAGFVERGRDVALER